MANEIIDLTTSPTSEESVIRDTEQPVSSFRIQPGADGEGKRSRRKRRKRSLVAGSSQSSAAQTREHSLEEGELDRHFIQHQERHFSGENGNIKRKRPTVKEQERLPPSLRQPPSSPRSPADAVDVFFIDFEPTLLPTAYSLVPPNVSDVPDDKLLLPAHVSVFGLTPAEILPASNVDLDDEDYIEYLEYNEQKDLVRYFEDPIEGSAKKANRIVCKNCGTEGEHRTAACPVSICLTCGARNEHPTRSCPISKTCFTCGMKGHINATCPNRNSARMLNFDRFDDCSRCGSRLHHANECPTLWRLYEYLADEEQEHTLRTREDWRNRSLGQGGEGYIAADEWCYNCGCCGHWGDDCQDIPHRGDLPEEPSAFSTHNTLSGPFFDAELPRSISLRREPREWEHYDHSSSWGNDLPEHVGRQGRRKNAEMMERRVKQQEADEDPEDWFGNARHSLPNKKRLPIGPSKKMSFGKSVQKAGQQFRPPSLADRLGEPLDHSATRKPASSRSARTNYHYSRKNHSKRDDSRQGDRRREEVGPRYKGGYAR